MTIAAILAATTMGSALAAATTVPGIPSDTFQFNKIGTSDVDLNGSGSVAIDNVNAILAAVSQGGATIDTDAFWKSFVSPTRVEIFDYASAKPMIEELVYIVKGEYSDSGSWVDTNDGSTDGVYFAGKAGDRFSSLASGTVSLETVETDAGGTVGGDETISGFTMAGTSWTQAELEVIADKKVGDDEFLTRWSNGQLEAKGTAAVSLLTTIGYTGTAGVLGKIDSDYNLTSDAVDVDNFVNPESDDKAALITTILASGSTFVADAEAAKVDAVAFTTANTLIDLIADQLKDGYILDVAAATAAVDGIIDHHNDYLSASIMADAINLKKVIKNLYLQTAAAEVGLVADGFCTNSGGNATPKVDACVEVGQGFDRIATKIFDLGSVSVVDYNDAITRIKTLAGNLGSFNTANVTAYAASDITDAIEDQFGTILVKDDSAAYLHLEDPNTTGNKFGVSDWTNGTAKSDVTITDSDGNVSTLFDADFSISVWGAGLDGILGDDTSTGVDESADDVEATSSADL